MEKIKISVVIIAKNEEKNIAACLDSVKWADEIIVVDGFSTDKTADIARARGAKVIEHKFTGAFADDRNIGMDAATSDWVLQLDADDIATEGFKDKVRKVLDDNKEGHVVYKFRRVNFFLGHSMNHGGFHHYIPNLVNRKNVRFEGKVHEIPVYEGSVGTIEADIEHHPFDSISQFIDRQNRYTDIAAGDILNKEGKLPASRIRSEMIGKSFRIFWKSYFRKKGYREGFYGLIFAILFSLINFMKWAKYWEMVKDG